MGRALLPGGPPRLGWRSVVFHALRSLCRLALAAAPLLGAGCSSGPDLTRVVTIEEGQPVSVRYEQYQSGLRQTLLTEGVVAAHELYSARESDPLAKVMSTEQMQVLLDALATYGFFDRARTLDPGESVSSIAVRIDDRELLWAKRPTMELDELTGYHQALAAFLNLYNATEAFHSSGESRILDEGERIRRRNEEALRRARGAGEQDGGTGKDGR